MSPSRHRRLWLLSGAGALVAAAVLLLLLTDSSPAPQPVPTTQHADRDVRPASLRPSGTTDGDEDDGPPQPSAGMRLRIPSIGVDTRVIQLGREPDGELEVPTDYDEAGLWTGGPAPGEEGAAVIAGHVDSRETGPAVFYRLDDLSPGDTVEVVYDSGLRAEFTVDGLEEHPKNDFPTQAVYGWTPRPELRLITCSGRFDERTGHYLNNTIVFASQGPDA